VILSTHPFHSSHAPFPQLCLQNFALPQVIHGMALSQEITVTIHHCCDHRRKLSTSGIPADAQDASRDLTIDYHLRKTAHRCLPSANPRQLIGARGRQD
jgi:hypothetical protein